MKKLLLRLTVPIVGVLAILGLNVKDVKAFAPAHSPVFESTPLYLQDAGSLLANGGTNWHSSHYSHSSHESHSSHYSHYSSR